MTIGGTSASSDRFDLGGHDTMFPSGSSSSLSSEEEGKSGVAGGHLVVVHRNNVWDL